MINGNMFTRSFSFEKMGERMLIKKKHDGMGP